MLETVRTFQSKSESPAGIVFLDRKHPFMPKNRARAKKKSDVARRGEIVNMEELTTSIPGLFFKLIVGVTLALVSFMPLSVTADELPSSLKNDKTQTINYPPYPDVWDWHEPSISGYPFSMYRLQNGDVLVKFIKQSAKTKMIEVYAVTFYGRKVFFGEDARRILKKAEEDMHKRWGRDLEAKLNYMKYDAISSDGIWNIKSEYAYDLHCYLGANRYPFKLTNTKAGQERTFTIFRLLDEPEEFYVHGRYGLRGTRDEGKVFPEATCDSGVRRTVAYRVNSISGNFFYLEDNSFLFQAEETGEVIRFDNDLKSKSSLVGDRFFLIENNGEHSISHRLTGKDYEDDVDPVVETEDLYNYLTAIIQNKGRK